MTVIVPKPDLMRSLEASTEAYSKQLLNDEKALEYLTTDRRVSKEAMEYFQLGVVRDPQPGHEVYRGRLAFPYHTAAGIVSIRFRFLGDPGENRKYLSVAGDGIRPYNVRALRGQSKVFVCEGETDTIACWQAGIPAVGFPGAEAWQTKDLGRVFARMLWNRQVTVLADNDDTGAGKEFAKDVNRFLGGCAIIHLPEGYDVSKYYHEYGGAELRKKAGL